MTQRQNPPLRLGILCHPSVGGSGLVASQLALALAQLGHEVHVLSSRRPFKLGHHPNLQCHCVPTPDYPLLGNELHLYSLTSTLARLVDELQLELVHCHYAIPHSLCAALALNMCRRDIPLVTTLHGTDVSLVGQDDDVQPLNQYAINQSDRVTTVSYGQRRLIREAFHIDRPLDVVHNFIDTEVFSPERADPELRRRLAPKGEKLVMHASNFRPVKNTEGVIRAFAKLERRINARLIMLGNGPDMEGAANLCHRLGIDERTTFLGDVERVEEYLPNADVVIQPSRKEAFGMVALEAMACAVPVVASDVDGIPEVVEQGISGLLAPAEDIDGLAGHLASLLTDPLTASRMGRAGREQALAAFTPKFQVRRYLDCYDRAILEHRAARSRP